VERAELRIVVLEAVVAQQRVRRTTETTTRERNTGTPSDHEVTKGAISAGSLYLVEKEKRIVGRIKKTRKMMVTVS
jgi:hypothetical protein